jgi:hypothetical protein
MRTFPKLLNFWQHLLIPSLEAVFINPCFSVLTESVILRSHAGMAKQTRGRQLAQVSSPS